MPEKRKPVSVALTNSKEASCTKRQDSGGKESYAGHILLHCTFGRRKFDVKLPHKDGGQATFAQLAEAVMKETDIPCEKQRLLFKGIVMDPPDLSGFSMLQDLNVRSGDKILIVNSRRVGIDDEEKLKFEEIFPRVKQTDQALQELFYELDKLQRGQQVCRLNIECKLAQLRSRALELEKDYNKHIQVANNITFDYRNAVDQARRRDVIDTCQRKLDKIEEFTSSIFDRLALTQAAVGGTPVLKIAFKDGPCPRVEKIYEGPCK